MDDQLTQEQRIRREALALAVEFTKDGHLYKGNSITDGTVDVAKRYAKYIKDGS